MRRRIWSEAVPFEDLARADVRGLLARHRLSPIVAVRPWSTGLARVVRALRGEGLEVAIWPMLDDARGRWANARNEAEHSAFTMRVVGELEAEGARPDEVFVDLEPPIEDVKSILALAPIDARRIPLDVDPYRFAAARDGFTVLAQSLAERGVRASAAIVPTVLFDRPGDAKWQQALSTPVDGPGFTTVSAMLYTSILEGWSRRVLDRRDVRALLSAATLAAVARFGDRASVSLGCVGTGALGDEPIYRSPDELADDVAIAAEAGATDLALFDLGGVLARPPVDAWLDAFTRAPRAIERPPATFRSRAGLGAARLAGGALAWLTRWATLGRAW